MKTDTYENTHDGAYEEAYDDVYEKTYDDAYEKAYDDAYEKAYDDAYEKAYDDAYEKAYDEAYEKAYEKQNCKNPAENSTSQRIFLSYIASMHVFSYTCSPKFIHISRAHFRAPLLSPYTLASEFSYTDVCTRGTRSKS